MKLLIVEDHQELAQNINSYLSKEGNICEVAKNFDEAVEKINLYPYDILLLDLMLPNGNGLEILQKLKELKPETGVLIISAKNSLDDKIAGLNLGADDYLEKPFHLSELNARIKAIQRRRQLSGKEEIKFEEISLNTDTMEVTVTNNTLDLTRKEYELLLYMLTNKNRVLTKQSIAEHLWGDYVDSMDSFDFVYQHVKNLRKKILEAGGKDYIKTMYGSGYKFTSL